MKKELDKKRLKKKEDKAYRKEERLKNATGGDLDSMLAYVNENGEIVSTPQTKSIVEEDEPATH